MIFLVVKNKFILFFLLIFLLKFPAFPQSQKLNFKHYTINEGLSQNAVLFMLQDREGFMWIGTEDGLNRFDGYDFTIYKQENKNRTAISNSRIYSILEDPRGNLWAGTANGLNLFDRKKGRFTKIAFSSGKHTELDEVITSLWYGSGNNFWIGTFAGLKLYDIDSKKYHNYYLHNPVNGSRQNRVRTIFEDDHKMLWVSIGNDLRRFDPVKKNFLPLPGVLEKNLLLRQGVVRVIRQSKSGVYWFGTESDGLFTYNARTNSCINYRHDPLVANGLPANVIRDLCFKSDNELWIATRDGLSILNTSTAKFSLYRHNKYDEKTLSHNSVRSITKDKSGNMWLGTYYGGVNIFSLSSINFNNIKERLGGEPGINFPVVSSILSEGNNAFWVGTEGGGLNFMDHEKGIYKAGFIKNNKHHIVKSLFKDTRGILWIGTFDGLLSLDIKTGSVKNYSIGRSDDRSANNQVFALAETSRGLWLGTGEQGLVLMNRKGKDTAYLRNPGRNGISSNAVFALLKGANDALWIGTDRGLDLLDKGGRFSHYAYKESDPFSINNNLISTLFIDSRSILWVGTKGGGLNLFDEKTKKFYSITEKNGLPNNIIHGIKEDRSGNIWVSTNKGLSKLVLKQLKLPLSSRMFSIMNYMVEDGLQSNQFSPNAAEIGVDGELLFGGINGITTFFPEKIISNTYKPKVVLTELLIKNKTVDPMSQDSPLEKSITETDKLVLSHDQAFIMLKFAALNFINPNKNKYAYKLQGFDDDNWHYVGSQRTATYTNLNAGNYIFKVKSANNDGVWNEVPTSLEITILPPWWKSWWAFMGYTLIILVLLYLYYSFSIRTVALKNELLIESKIREKDQELYQRKLSFFTNISHEIKTPLTLILAPLEKLLAINNGNNRIQNQLMLMKRNGERLVRLINQLLDFRKFESGNMALQAAEGNIVRFIREVIFAFDSYAKHLDIKLVMNTGQKSIRLWFDRDKFEKILYNLLSNALKFTRPGGEIVVNVSTIEDTFPGYVIIEVEDNGRGILEKNIEKIFDQFSHYDEDGNNRYGTGIGLTFTKGLVELHHGSITVESKEAKEGANGRTCFSVKIPLGNAHLLPDEMITNYKDSENIDAYLQAEETTTAMPAEGVENRVERLSASHQGETPVMLIVEDNVDVMNFLVAHFEERFKVCKSFNGREGVEQAISVIPDIIISDVMMPEMSGTMLCSTLKSDNRTSHIPIILLTARTPLIHKIEGLETGADDYITKPFSIQIVETRVWNLLESRKQLRERYRKEITLQPNNLAITLPDEIFLDKVMDFIDRNLAETTLNVEALGKELFMSRVSLYRKIKALTNQTTIEFIRSIRLKKAAQFLETGNYSVNEVGYMIGFTDIDYFRKCFKEQFKQTPKEYTRTHLDDRNRAIFESKEEMKDL